MKISELFELIQGNSFELINMTETEYSQINFVSRTSNNNGVVAKVEKYLNTVPFEAGNLTVALGGSVLSTFVQVKPFYTGFHVMVLKPKHEMTLNEKLYYALCIKYNAYRYGYGRQANKTLKDMEVPDIVPKEFKNYKINYDIIKTNKNYSEIDFLTNTWKEFKLINYFNMHTGKYYNSEDYEKGSIPLVSASDTDNGIMSYTNLQPKFNGNCLTIGKVGITTFYQKEPFVASPDVTVLVPKNKFNKYIGLFIKTIINAEKFKWNYGRQIRLGDCQKLMVKLPSTLLGEPDWEYMEQYIKSLPYSDKI